MANRDKYYKFNNFPDNLTLSSDILYMLIELYPEINDKAFTLAKSETKNDINNWLNINLKNCNYEIIGEINHSTKDPEDLVDNLFEGELKIIVSNYKDLFSIFKINNKLIEKLKNPIEITLGQNIKIKTSDKISKREKSELLNALGFFFRKPSYDFLGDEHLPNKYFLNVSKFAKQGYTESIIDSYIIKVPTIGKTTLISPFGEEYTEFVNKIDNLKLSRKLKNDLEVNKSPQKKIKI